MEEHNDLDYTIMFVEDSRIMRMMFSDKIKEFLGLKVVLMENGIQGFDYYLKNPKLRLIFTDILMPEISGDILASMIRERESVNGRPKIPIISISNCKDSEIVEMDKSKGIDDRLSKPVVDSDLKDLLVKYGYELIKNN